jgi:hypothetical protein
MASLGIEIATASPCSYCGHRVATELVNEMWIDLKGFAPCVARQGKLIRLGKKS